MPKSTSARPISAASDSGDVKRWALAVQIDVSPKVPCAHALPLNESAVPVSPVTSAGLGNTRHTEKNPYAGCSDEAAAGAQRLRTPRQNLYQANGDAR